MKAALPTQDVWPSRVRRAFPLAASHSRTVLSLPTDTRVFPFGLIAIPATAPVCPVNVWSNSSGYSFSISFARSAGFRSSSPSATATAAVYHSQARSA